MKKWITGAAMAVALVGLTSQAGATVLAPGDTGAATAFSNAGWTLLGSDVGQSLTSSTFSATASAWVYSDTANTFCSGCLDFVYEVTRVSGTDPIEKVTGGDFTGFMTNFGYVDIGGAVPTLVERSNAGLVGTFDLSGLTGTQGTDLLVIETNASYFKAGGMAAIDSQSVNGVAFAPSSVPEPMTFSLMGAGLLGLGLLRKRIGRS